MQFAAHGVRGLADERGNFVVAQLFVGDKQKQQAVFVWQGIQGLLDTLAQFLGFQNTQGRIGFCRGIFPDGILGSGVDMTIMPRLAKVIAMVDGDAVKPGAHGGITAKLIQPTEGLQKNVMSCILGPRHIAQKPQGEIENRPTV